MTTKGIAVLSTSTGQPVHKLLDDGSAVISEAGSAAAVSLNGDVLVENLNVKVKTVEGTLVMDATGANADNLADVMNGIANTLSNEVTDADGVRGQLDDDLDNLIAAAGLTPGTTNGPSGEITAMAPDFSHAGMRYISESTTMHAADEALSGECVRQNGVIDTLVNTTIPGAISDAKGTLAGEQLDTLAEIAASIANDAGFAATVVGDVGTAISQLEGTVTAANDTLEEVEDLIEAEENRASETTGAQKDLQDDIDDIQAGVGLNGADGELLGTDQKPVAADITLDTAIKALENSLTPLQTNFVGVGVTITGASLINGHMRCSDGTNSGTFNFPKKDHTQVMLMAAPVASDNGKVFFLNAPDNQARTTAPAGDFSDGMKLYFCESGVWHSSNLLKVEEGQ